MLLLVLTDRIRQHSAGYGLGYGNEFGPFVGAEIVDEGRRDPQSVPMRDADGNVVTDADGEPIYVMHIISDGLTSNGGEVSPDGKERWGWHPIPCAEPVGNFEGIQVVNPSSDRVPTSDDADTDLDDYPDGAFDICILSQTIQATRAPKHVLGNLVRIGGRAIGHAPLHFLHEVFGQRAEQLPARAHQVVHGGGRYVRALDTADPDGYAAVYTPDGQFSAGANATKYTGRAIVIRDLLEMLLARARVPITVKVDPARYRPNDLPLLVGDPSRLRSELGWQPEIPIERTLDDLLEYWRTR